MRLRQALPDPLVVALSGCRHRLGSLNRLGIPPWTSCHSGYGYKVRGGQYPDRSLPRKLGSDQ